MYVRYKDQGATDKETPPHTGEKGGAFRSRMEPRGGWGRGGAFG